MVDFVSKNVHFYDIIYDVIKIEVRKMAREKKEVCLWGLDQLALIILYKSGVNYYNQVGGNFCLCMEEEGLLTIIFDVTRILEELSAFCINKIRLTEEDAHKIDRILQKHGTSYLSVDRNRLDASMEAWLYVNILPESERDNFIKKIDDMGDSSPINHPGFDFWGFEETKGVLTWGNSD